MVKTILFSFKRNKLKIALRVRIILCYYKNLVFILSTLYSRTENILFLLKKKQNMKLGKIECSQEI